MIDCIQLQSPQGASKTVLILYFFIIMFSERLKFFVFFKVDPGPEILSSLSQ